LRVRRMGARRANWPASRHNAFSSSSAAAIRVHCKAHWISEPTSILTPRACMRACRCPLARAVAHSSSCDCPWHSLSGWPLHACSQLLATLWSAVWFQSHDWARVFWPAVWPCHNAHVITLQLVTACMHLDDMGRACVQPLTLPSHTLLSHSRTRTDSHGVHRRRSGRQRRVGSVQRRRSPR